MQVFHPWEGVVGSCSLLEKIASFQSFYFGRKMSSSGCEYCYLNLIISWNDSIKQETQQFGGKQTNLLSSFCIRNRLLPWQPKQLRPTGNIVINLILLLN